MCSNDHVITCCDVLLLINLIHVYSTHVRIYVILHKLSVHKKNFYKKTLNSCLYSDPVASLSIALSWISLIDKPINNNR